MLKVGLAQDTAASTDTADSLLKSFVGRIILRLPMDVFGSPASSIGGASTSPVLHHYFLPQAGPAEAAAQAAQLSRFGTTTSYYNINNITCMYYSITK